MKAGRIAPSERRQIILALLCHNRHDTCDNLAQKFDVSRATICHDIMILMCSYPIETVRGGHGGGVKVADGFYLHHKTLSAQQIDLLMEIREWLSGDKLDTLNSILYQFTL